VTFSRCFPLAVLTVLAIAGCGGGSTGPGTTNPTASAPDATAPPADATQPGTAPTTTAPAQTQTQPSGDDGGEQSVRVPASYVVTSSGRLTPPTITVPPLLAVEISIRAQDGRSHTLVLQTKPPHTLRAAAGTQASLRIPGLRAGRYAVTLDGRDAGALVAGGEVGP
jgi:hypothetical protein